MTEFTDAQAADFTNPDSVLQRLFDAGGGTQAGLQVAKEVTAGGHDPIEDAKNAAKRGVLSTAMEYIQIASVPVAEKIKLANEVATTVARKFADKKTKSPIDDHFALGATAVMQGSMRFLQTQKSIIL